MKRRSAAPTKQGRYDFPAPTNGVSYVIKDIEKEAWEAFKAKAETHNRSARWVLMRFIHDYGSGETS